MTHAQSKQRIAELELALANERRKPELTAFGTRVFENYGLMVIWNVPPENWPSSFQKAFEHEQQKTPTLAHEWRLACENSFKK